MKRKSALIISEAEESNSREPVNLSSDSEEDIPTESDKEFIDDSASFSDYESYLELVVSCFYNYRCLYLYIVQNVVLFVKV